MIYIFVISNRNSRNLSKSASKKFGPLRLANEAGRFVTLRFREVSGPRGGTLRTFLLRSATQLIRTLAIVHVHVFGIDHIAGLPALRAAGRVRAWTTRSALSACASSRRVCLSRPASRLGALVELFS